MTRQAIQTSDPNTNAMLAISSARWPRPYGLGWAGVSMMFRISYRNLASPAGPMQPRVGSVARGAPAKEHEVALFRHHAVLAALQRRHQLIAFRADQRVAPQQIVGVEVPV